jgi:hypothetical protein
MTKGITVAAGVDASTLVEEAFQEVGASFDRCSSMAREEELWCSCSHISRTLVIKTRGAGVDQKKVADRFDGVVSYRKPRKGGWPMASLGEISTSTDGADC